MLLKNALLCDVSQERDGDLRIDEERGIISEVGENLAVMEGEQVLECGGKVLMPALIDMAYTKSRILSQKHLQTLDEKALRGGVGSIVLRPESTPRIDSAAIIELVASLDSRSKARFFSSIAPCAPKHTSSCAINEIASLISAGARAIYLESSAQHIDGFSLYTIAQYANMLNVPIIASPEEPSLSEGVMNESRISAQLGLQAIPPLAQSLQVARLCELARYSGVTMVFDVISEPDSLAIIRAFCALGAKIVAQASIHHLVLSDEECAEFDTRFKLFPPLKDSATCEILRAHIDEFAMLTSLQNDSYKAEKDRVFEEASFGVDAMWHYLALGITYLVKPKLISLSRFSELTSYAQARLLSLPKGALAVGLDADIVLVDMEKSSIIDDPFSPYYGKRLYGCVEQIFLGGKARL